MPGERIETPISDTVSMWLPWNHIVIIVIDDFVWLGLRPAPVMNMWIMVLAAVLQEIAIRSFVQWLFLAE